MEDGQYLNVLPREVIHDAVVPQNDLPQSGIAELGTMRPDFGKSSKRSTASMTSTTNSWEYWVESFSMNCAMDFRSSNA